MTKKKSKKIAIFDIDGTIFRKNLHFELINELAWMKVFPHEVRNRLTEIYSNWLEHEGTYEDYRKALVELLAVVVAGRALDLRADLVGAGLDVLGLAEIGRAHV